MRGPADRHQSVVLLSSRAARFALAAHREHEDHVSPRRRTDVRQRTPQARNLIDGKRRTQHPPREAGKFFQYLPGCDLRTTRNNAAASASSISASERTKPSRRRSRTATPKCRHRPRAVPASTASTNPKRASRRPRPHCPARARARHPRRSSRPGSGARRRHCRFRAQRVRPLCPPCCSNFRRNIVPCVRAKR